METKEVIVYRPISNVFEDYLSKYYRVGDMESHKLQCVVLKKIEFEGLPFDASVLKVISVDGSANHELVNHEFPHPLFKE